MTKKLKISPFISESEILKREADFMRLLDFNIDLVTHYDFLETLYHKLKLSIDHQNKDDE